MIKLDRLINVLGDYSHRLVEAGQGRDEELRSVAIHDPSASGPTIGDAYLAVGVDTLPRAAELAIAAQATVLLARTGETPSSEVLTTTREHGVSLVLLDPGISWSQIAGVVYGLVLEGRETESGRGPADLSALVDTIAAAVGGAVTIQDRHYRVMAYSSLKQDSDPAHLDTILGRRLPDGLRTVLDERGVLTHLVDSDEPLFVPAESELGLYGRTVVAVRAGKELLGSVWVACEAPLGPGRTQTLTNGAHTVALHLLRHRVSADLERQVESELVIQLLEGTPDATAVISKLGLPPQRHRVVALQVRTRSDQHAGILLAFERATTGFGWSRPGRSTLFGNTVYTLLPCDGDPAPARDWVGDIKRGMPPQVVLTAGIGGPSEPAEMPASRQEADESLVLHAAQPDRPPVSYDESWDEILLQRLRTVASAGRIPPRGPLVELARHDEANDTNYVPTLRAWIEAQGDHGAAATQLDVHPNTVRNRIRKMTNLVDLHLDDPSKRLAMLITLATDSRTRPH